MSSLRKTTPRGSCFGKATPPPPFADSPEGKRHYIENTSETEDLVWIELYRSDKVQDISLTQWLALTPADIVAQTLKVNISFVQQLKKEKQILVKGQ